jgi:hypothetical protein
MGVWRIEFHAGTDTDFLNGKKVASGTYTISGTTITFAQPAVPSGAPVTCRSPGKYTFSLPGRTLKLTKISDPCNSIRSELLSHRFSAISDTPWHDGGGRRQRRKALVMVGKPLPEHALKEDQLPYMLFDGQ